MKKAIFFYSILVCLLLYSPLTSGANSYFLLIRNLPQLGGLGNQESGIDTFLVNTQLSNLGGIGGITTLTSSHFHRKPFAMEWKSSANTPFSHLEILKKEATFGGLLADSFSSPSKSILSPEKNLFDLSGSVKSILLRDFEQPSVFPDFIISKDQLLAKSNEHWFGKFESRRQKRKMRVDQARSKYKGGLRLCNNEINLRAFGLSFLKLSRTKNCYKFDFAKIR